MKNWKVDKELRVEARRKVLHLMVVLAMAGLFRALEFWLIPFLALVLMAGVAASELCIRGYRLPLLSWGICHFDRPEDVLFRPGLGVLMLLTGVLSALLLALLLQSPPGVAMGAILLSAADTLSTVVGVAVGRHQWKHNPRKTVEGTAAFLALGAATTWLMFRNPLALAAPVVAAAVETLPHVDDNFSVPVTAFMVLHSVAK